MCPREIELIKGLFGEQYKVTYEAVLVFYL